MKRLLLWIALQGMALTLTWNVVPPPGWTHEPIDGQDPSLVARLRPTDFKQDGQVVIRRYIRPDTTLANELRQLRYGVVLELEGKILSSQPWTLAGQPGLKVLYQGRSSRGIFKRFVRYMTIRGDELITIHCVFSLKTKADEAAQFQQIAQTLRFEKPSSSSPPEEQ